MDALLQIIGLIAAIAVLVVLVVFGRVFKLWVQARVSGAPVGLLELVGMWLRKVDMFTIVQSRIRAALAGLDISVNQLETHHIAGGRVTSVVSALIAAERDGIDLDWDTACAIDREGRDVLAEVEQAAQGA